MILILAIAIGCLYAGGVYMMLRRSLFKLILGLVLLSHGANLLIFTSGMLRDVRRPHPPVIPIQAQSAPPGTADPLPQALILTAIVISFGVLAFALVLCHRTHLTTGSDDPDHLRVTES